MRLPVGSSSPVTLSDLRSASLVLPLLDDFERGDTGPIERVDRRHEAPSAALSLRTGTNALFRCAETTAMGRVTRSAVGYGLLFAAPPGIGTGIFVSRLQAGSLVLGTAFGTLLSVSLFVLVVYAASTGTPDIDRGETNDGEASNDAAGDGTVGGEIESGEPADDPNRGDSIEPNEVGPDGINDEREAGGDGNETT